MKKIPFTSGNGNPKRFSYISENGTFQYKLKKIKEISTKKMFYISGNGSLPKILIFPQKKVFLISGKQRPKKLLYIPGNRNQKNSLYFTKELSQL